MLTIAMPHCGFAAHSTSGGEVVERELLVRIERHGIEAHVLSPSWRGLRWWNSPVYFASPLRACCRDHQPRLIRAHSLRYAGPAAIAAKRRYDIPLVTHFHHLDDDRLAWLDRWVLRHADLVTTDSEYSRRQVEGLGIHATRIPLGVDHARFAPTPCPPGHTVLFMGGNKPRKNLSFLATLWPQVVLRVPDAHLLIVGAGSPQRDEAMPALYRQARVLAFPSLLEGFGLPVLEAMASARPVVCSDRGALPELGAETTLPLRPALWVEALVRYLTDDRAWTHAATANHAHSGSYSWERTARLTAEVWKAIAA